MTDWITAGFTESIRGLVIGAFLLGAAGVGVLVGLWFAIQWLVHHVAIR